MEVKNFFKNPFVKKICLASIMVIGTIIVDAVKKELGDNVVINVDLKK